MKNTYNIHTHKIICLFLLFFITGCAMATVDNIESKDYIAMKRKDILTTGVLSQITQEEIRKSGQRILAFNESAKYAYAYLFAQEFSNQDRSFMETPPVSAILKFSGTTTNEIINTKKGEILNTMGIIQTDLDTQPKKVKKIPNSIDNLDKNDLFIKTSAQFPISPFLRLFVSYTKICVLIMN